VFDPGRVGATWHDFAGDQQTAAAQHPRDLARLRRVRDRIDREHARPPDIEALARGADMSAGHLSREFRLAYRTSPYGYLMTRRIERAMALLRRGDLSVTEVRVAVGRSSPGTVSSGFTDLVGMPPRTYRRHAARATAGLPSCVAKQVTRAMRNREAPVSDAPGVTAMDITVHASSLPHDDPDASLAFCRDRPEALRVVLLLSRAGLG
jgi:AraC-like DNA-binding protein